MLQAFGLAFTLFYLAINCASAAYLQWGSCSQRNLLNSSFNDSPTLYAGLITPGQMHQPVLQVNFSFWSTDEDCMRAANVITSTELQLEMPSGLSVFKQPANGSCRPFIFPDGLSGAILEVPTTLTDFEALPPLATMRLRLRILYTVVLENEMTCLEANMTPALGGPVSTAIQSLTWTILAVVFVAALLRTMRHDTTVANHDASEEQRRIRILGMLPDLGDYLQYLQFIFLTGGLSISYPGFYQPVVGQLHWFSLFINGDIARGPSYKGIRDGVYETNSTSAGGSGLRLMAQTISAPMSMDMWLNMVLLLTIIVLLAALILQAYRSFTPRSRRYTDEKKLTGLLYASSQVFPVVLSYFLLPLVALSIYEVCQSASLALAYALLVVVVVFVTLATLMWLSHRLTILGFGILTIGLSKHCRSISISGAEPQHRQTALLTLTTVTFARAIAIGALQTAGQAQLAVLMACEIVLLGSIVGLRAAPAVSVVTISALVRLCSLVFMAPFDHTVTYKTRCIFGYVVLALHGCMLVFGYLAPALYRLLGLILQKKLPAQVYGLRELRRRKFPPTNPDALQQVDTTYHPTNPSLVPSPVLSYFDSPAYLGRFYRPPRSPSSAHLGKEFGDESTISSAAMTARSPSSSTAPLQGGIPSSATADEGKLKQETTSISTVQSPATSPARSCGRRLSLPRMAPLGPFWNDYSFREADMFYGRAFRSDTADAPEAAVGQPRINFSPFSVWERLVGRWQKVETTSKGFEVIRPARQPGP